MLYPNNLNTARIRSAFFLCCLAYPFCPSDAAEGAGQSDEARRILAETGVQGGVIVHLGCGDGRLTAELKANDRYLVHGLDVDVQSIERARENILAMGRYGNVSVAAFDGQRLPYADNVVNLLVATGECHVESQEIARVLAPGGVAIPLQPSASSLQPFVKP